MLLLILLALRVLLILRLLLYIRVITPPPYERFPSLLPTLLGIVASDDDCIPPRDTSPHQDSTGTAPSGTPPPAQPPPPPHNGEHSPTARQLPNRAFRKTKPTRGKRQRVHR